MIPLLAALLLALAIYSPIELFQNQFYFQNPFAKISIERLRNYLPVYKPKVCIRGGAIGSFINENKENDIISGFV